MTANIVNVTEIYCCSAVSRNYGGKTREIMILLFFSKSIYER